MMVYQNPILYADYSDPDVIRVGEDYYMVSSSFTYFPGVPLLHSRDLVHWEIINYCVPALPYEKYQLPSHGSGTWAPSIRYHQGTFYVFVPLPDEGIFVARSSDPYGDFTLNCLCETTGWIDPCPFWDDDGKAYMVFAYARSRCGIKHRLALVEIDEQCTRLTGTPETIFEGRQLGPTTEGPKIYKYQGYYYILMPSGGVATGWQSALRAKDIRGPYEYKIVMHQGDTAVNGPHQGGWVDTPDGSSWFLHFQDVGSLGRIVHLQPLCFNGGWPFIGVETNGDGIGEPVSEWELPVEGQPCYQIAGSDEFEGCRLGLQWQWQAVFRQEFCSLTERPGFLRLYCRCLEARENLLWYAPNVLTQIPQSRCFTATVRLQLHAGRDGDMAALGMTGHQYAYAALKQEAGLTRICICRGTVTKKEHLGEAREDCAASMDYGKDQVYLRMAVHEDETYGFFWSEDGISYQSVGPSCTLSKGTWTGAKLCLWAAGCGSISSGGYGDYEYIHIENGSGR
ncbi:MAG: glycoside hydrolase family 43 protein [Lachnospiraceae bacterium]